MSRMKEQEAAIRQRIGEVDAEIANLTGLRNGMIEALGLIGGDVSAMSVSTPRSANDAPRSRSRGVKEAVLGIVTKAGDRGLSVNEVLEQAQADGVHLDRGSVSSLLSRLKREGTLTMDEGRYSPKKANAGWGAPMH